MTPILLAYIGVALMVGVSGLSSALGTSIAGMASVGAMKKNSNAFGSYLVLCAMPGSSGLYGFVCYFILAKFLTAGITMLQASAIFAAGIIVAVISLLVSWFQAKVCANGIAAIGNGHNVMGNTLILAAYPELYAILSVAITFLISAAIGEPVV